MLGKYEEYAPLFIRIGLGLVWFLFGIDKFIAPLNWLGYIPQWMPLPFSKEVFIFLLGIVETIIGIGLLLGLLTRFFAFISAVMMMPIMIAVGYNEIFIRDIAIFLMAVAMVLRKSTPYALENYWRKS